MQSAASRLLTMRPKYQALLVSLCLAQSMRFEVGLIFCNSQSVVNQIKGDFDMKDEWITRYAA